jgi:hypothetical protein
LLEACAFISNAYYRTRWKVLKEYLYLLSARNHRKLDLCNNQLFPLLEMFDWQREPAMVEVKTLMIQLLDYTGQ